MKGVHIIITLLVWSLSASSQELSDSAYWETEMEDSVSSFAIKPIKRPKKLLKQVIEKIILDAHQKPKTNRYQIEATFGEGSPSSFAVTCNFSAEAGFGLEKLKLEKFHYEGPLKLTLRDTISIESFLLNWAAVNPVRMHKEYFSWNEIKSSNDILKKTIEGLDEHIITAYNISDASGRAVYRISFEPKKRKYYATEITGTAYFDSTTLRMTQFKGETHVGYGSRIRYQIDYEEKGKTPVVKQINMIGAKDDMIMKATVRRSP